MVVTNHPLASLAGTQILLEGGNAVDAAVAALFALCVVEPMMVGLLGGGVAHIRNADGRHVILDGLSTAPAAATADMFEHAPPGANDSGPLAMAVPGALTGWCTALAQFGTASLQDVLAPAIRLAERGFIVTPYLTDCVTDEAAGLAQDPDLARLFLPGGAPIAPGTRLQRPDFAATLRLVAQHGAAVLHGGTLGSVVAAHVARCGGLVTVADLAAARTIERVPVCGQYRGYAVYGPPPPSSGGAHIAQMLNILEGYDVAGLGFGTVDGVHLLAEGDEDRLRRSRRGHGRPGFRRHPARPADRQGLRRRAPGRDRHDPGAGLAAGRGAG